MVSPFRSDRLLIISARIYYISTVCIAKCWVCTLCVYHQSSAVTTLLYHIFPKPLPTFQVHYIPISGREKWIMNKNEINGGSLWLTHSQTRPIVLDRKLCRRPSRRVIRSVSTIQKCQYHSSSSSSLDRHVACHKSGPKSPEIHVFTVWAESTPDTPNQTNADSKIWSWKTEKLRANNTNVFMMGARKYSTSVSLLDCIVERRRCKASANRQNPVLNDIPLPFFMWEKY